MTSNELRELYESAPDPPWLEGLSTVDWSAVEHAHGPATDVPALLRAAVSDDPDHRDFAWELLFETVWHQGTVYSASATVVLFLFRLLEADGVPGQSVAAQLLASIADGHSYLAVHAATPESLAIQERISAKRGSTLAADLARELEYVATARRAVGAQLDLLCPYLRDPEPFVRSCVAVAIGHYPEVAAELGPELEAALRAVPEEHVPDEQALEHVRALLRELIERAGRGHPPYDDGQ